MNTNTGDKLSDKHLVDKLLAGDPGAFNTVIKATERMVAQIVFKMVDDAEQRKDIAQDVYLKAFRKLESFRKEAKLSTWICQIAYNTCIDHLRKMRRLAVYETTTLRNVHDSPDDGCTSDDQAAADDPSDAMIKRKELSNILKTGIGKLSPVYRTLITLYHQEEMSYLEIAEITGLPDGTIKSYLSRARKALKEHLLLTYKKSDL